MLSAKNKLVGTLALCCLFHIAFYLTEYLKVARNIQFFKGRGSNCFNFFEVAYCILIFTRIHDRFDLEGDHPQMMLKREIGVDPLSHKT